MALKKKDATVAGDTTEQTTEQNTEQTETKKSPDKKTAKKRKVKDDSTTQSDDTKKDATSDSGEDINVSDGGFTEDEKKVIGCNGEEISVANTKKMEMATQLLASQFNIDESFYLTKMDDKGNTMILGFANNDYSVTIKIKNVEEMGLIPE